MIVMNTAGLDKTLTRACWVVNLRLPVGHALQSSPLPRLSFFFFYLSRIFKICFTPMYQQPAYRERHEVEEEH